LTVILCSLIAGCGGSDRASPPPSNPETPTIPTPPAPTWSAAGTLVDIAGAPISDARIASSWDSTTVTTGGDGAFRFSTSNNPPTNPYRLSISGSDLVSRDLWLTWQNGPRTGIVLDAIRNRAPFSMEFYRQFVRGTYDTPGAPYAVLRWMESPKFYLRTVDQNGRAIEPEVLTVVREALGRAVTEFTAGKLSVAVLETGVETRPETAGWINVIIRREPNERSTCGFANIGANPGSITLHDDVCSCGSNKIPGALVLHEVGHAMGFFHVPDRNSVMYPFLPGNCPAGALSAAEKYHAAIAYSRPRGNLDPDNDPSSSRFLTSLPRLTTDR
jgi:hypothetical protein